MNNLPCLNEQNVINEISRYNDAEFTLIRLTTTMLNKSIIDANYFLRSLLKNADILDYDKIKNGEKLYAPTAFFDTKGEGHILETSCYLVNANKGKSGRIDKRFWPNGIKSFMRIDEINIGDLILFTTGKIDNENHIVIINITKNVSSTIAFSRIFVKNDFNEAWSRLKKMIISISNRGYIPNVKGAGKQDPKDVGETMEAQINMLPNNEKKADFEDKIELKAKSGFNTKDTLFTLRPNFEGTPIADIEPNDKKRVTAFQRKYGYLTEKYPNHKSLFITIGNKNAPQNGQGFFLDVNESKQRVELKHLSSSKITMTAHWSFDSLRKTLKEKHPATVWLTADVRIINEIVEFHYNKAELTKSPQFQTFIDLIRTGGIVYDWRGRTALNSKLKSVNKGNAWRMNPKFRATLFNEIEEIEL